MRFAERAILAQPLDYARAVAKDTLTTFGWTRVNETNAIGNLEGSGTKFRFEPAAYITPLPGWVTGRQHQRRGRAGLRRRELRAAVGGPAVELVPAALPAGRVPAGTFLLLFVVAGAVGVALGIRRRTRVPGTGWGGLGLLPWLTGVALLVLPPMTAGFSYRYALAAVPAICLAAGLAFTGRGKFHNLAA